MAKSRGCLIVTTMVVWLVVISAPAMAYPDHVNTGPAGSRLCRDDARMVDFTLVDTAGWSGQEQGWLRDSMKDWSSVRDFDARPLVEVRDGGGVKVYPRDAGPNNYGSATCEPDISGLAGDEIWVSSNPVFNDNESFYRTIARHEMGHMIGLEHSGNRDSETLDGRVPTMSTCLDWESDEFRRKALSQDDQEFLTHVHSSLGRSAFSPQAPLHTNIGFEQGTSFWGHQGGGFDVRPVGGATGPSYLAFRADTASDYVFQTATVLSGKGRAQAKINHMLDAPSDTGEVKVTLWRRPVDYNQPANSCRYPYVASMNDPAIGASFQLVAESDWVPPGRDWTALTTGFFDLGQSGHQLQVRVQSTVRNPVVGDLRSIRLDNIRAQCGVSNNLGECIN